MYEYKDIYDYLFEEGRFNYRRWAMEPDLLDTPVSTDQYCNYQVRKFKLYNIADIEASIRNDVKAKEELDWFHWEDIYKQPLSRLILICRLVGITIYDNSRESILKAMLEYKFENQRHQNISFLEKEMGLKTPSENITQDNSKNET